VVCRPKHVEQSRYIRIINFTTRLHLVGSFYEIYITMHGSTNIKFIMVSFIVFFPDQNIKSDNVINNQKLIFRDETKKKKFCNVSVVFVLLWFFKHRCI
jgi:hypothetical protein